MVVASWYVARAGTHRGGLLSWRTSRPPHSRISFPAPGTPPATRSDHVVDASIALPPSTNHVRQDLISPMCLETRHQLGNERHPAGWRRGSGLAYESGGCTVTGGRYPSGRPTFMTPLQCTAVLSPAQIDGHRRRNAADLSGHH
jgi:hypothetical protein